MSVKLNVVIDWAFDAQSQAISLEAALATVAVEASTNQEKVRPIHCFNGDEGLAFPSDCIRNLTQIENKNAIVMF